jgi:hypothetical protein
MYVLTCSVQQTVQRESSTLIKCDVNICDLAAMCQHKYMFIHVQLVRLVKNPPLIRLVNRIKGQSADSADLADGPACFPHYAKCDSLDREINHFLADGPPAAARVEGSCR